MEVRPAAAEDIPGLVEVLARAYRDDPLMCWIVGSGDDREARMRRFFAPSIRRIVGGSMRLVYTTPEVGGVAMWAEPETCKIPGRRMAGAVPAILAATGARGFLRSARSYGILHARHPKGRHWYLETIATHPEWQGRGVATALMLPVLERCDREGIEAYLETQNPANVPFYERRGFRVTGELDLPAGGPHMWQMLRAPRS